MYDEGIEIMIPSHLKISNSLLVSQYNWMSDDRKTVINVTRGSADLQESDIDLRLNEYYKRFNRDIKNFECKRVNKRRINGKTYGELQYLSCMMGYCFFNIFILGSYEGRELVFSIQCIDSNSKENLHIFENISDSLRILRKHDKNTNVMEDDEHAC
jgi:hypothetical protein